MIEQIDDKLVRWITSVVQATGDQVPVGLAGRIVECLDASAVQAVLLDARAVPVARGSTLADLQVSCRYLVFACADKPRQAHKILGQILLAALDGPTLDNARLDLDVEPEPPPAAWWSAAGVPPRPSLTLRLRDQKRRTTSLAGPAASSGSDRPAMGVLRGVVVGPGNTPVVGAEVVVPPSPTVYRTDKQGRFEIGPVPMGMTVTRLEVRANGVVKDVRAANGTPVTVVFESTARPIGLGSIGR